MNQQKSSSPLTYAQAGVDIEAGDRLVENIKPLIKKTNRTGVLSSLGGYGGLFELDLKKYPQPIMVSTTDGVGTKLKLAFETNCFDTVGIDLVAMCVNDLICCGAEPLFFLDYYATGKLDNQQATQVISGITKALSEINCALLGGETAEMPSLYQPGEFDLAGFAVGVVNKDKILDGSQVKAGDCLLGLHSSGVHSNGFSLVRKILSINKLSLDHVFDDLGIPLGKALLEPTRLYVNPALKLIESTGAHAIAHITGGGMEGNIPRVIPENLAITINKKSFPVPPLFSLLKRLGQIDEAEMWKVFNMGIGLVVVMDQKKVTQALELCQTLGFAASIIGEVVPKPSSNAEVLFV